MTATRSTRNRRISSSMEDYWSSPAARERRMQKFMTNVRVEPDGCWTWLTPLPNGRPPVGRIQAALRLFRDAELEPGQETHHACLNRTCVNPWHIVGLTRAEHVAEHMRLKFGGPDQ